MKTLFLGSFDAESFWRDKNLTKLPAISDKERNNIVTAMDELLFPFCQKNDVLITRCKMNDAFKDYLYNIGFDFICNKNADSNLAEASKKCIFQVLTESGNKDYYKSLLPDDIEFSPYAILPAAPKMCSQYNISYKGPNIDAIIKVNSKIYSCKLADRIGIKNWGKIVTSYAELEEVGKEHLKTSYFLIKDAFGVSGKGNLLINTESMLERIVSYIAGQEKQGKYTQFVVEPFLDKQDDFSCEFHIDTNGAFNITCVQKMINSDFAYNGSCSADDAFVSFLEKSGYFSCMEKVANELYKDGYFGDVCMDSMLLKNGEIVPIVEINARKSMGLINHYIDRYLSNFLLSGNLTFFSVGYSSTIKFEEMLEKMEVSRLLFKPEYGKGVMPLAANTLFINREMGGSPQKVYKGRFYASVVGDTAEERGRFTKEMREFFESLLFKVYN